MIYSAVSYFIKHKNILKLWSEQIFVDKISRYKTNISNFVEQLIKIKL